MASGTISHWYINSGGQMICNYCGSEVWYLAGGFICSGKTMCFNEDDEELTYE